MVLAMHAGFAFLEVGTVRAKNQVNALVKFPEGRQFSASQRSLWERLLNRFFSLYDDAPDIDSNQIINSLKDWMDRGDDDAITGLSGAESDYYEGLDPPYRCKNGPMDTIEEMRSSSTTSGPGRWRGRTDRERLAGEMVVNGPGGCIPAVAFPC